MKSTRLPSGATLYAQEYNALRSDAVGGSWLHAHQQLGALALGTNPTNGQAISFIVNGTTVTLTGKTGALVNPGDFAIQGTAAATDAVIAAALRTPGVTTSSFIGFNTPPTAPNATLLSYVGYALPTAGTTITAFSLNNSTYAPLTSFNVTTTVTGGTWTAQTMQLYVEDATIYIGSTQVKFLGASTPTVTGPVSNPRIDLLTIDKTGTLAWTTGTENASPVPPTYPVSKIPICEIYNVVGETAIYDNDNQQSGQGYISYDVRPFTGTIAGYLPSNNGGGTVSSATTQTIAHGLVRMPSALTLVATAGNSSSNPLLAVSIGWYNGTTQNAQNLGTGGQYAGIAFAENFGTGVMACTVTWDATNIYLTWTVYSGSAISVSYTWNIQ